MSDDNAYVQKLFELGFVEYSHPAERSPMRVRLLNKQPGETTTLPLPQAPVADMEGPTFLTIGGLLSITCASVAGKEYILHGAALDLRPYGFIPLLSDSRTIQ